jgi:hypothetical protein
MEGPAPSDALLLCPPPTPHLAAASLARQFCGEQFSEAAIGAHQTLCEEVQQLRQLTGDFSTPTRKDAHNEYYHKWSELYSECAARPPRCSPKGG